MRPIRYFAAIAATVLTASLVQAQEPEPKKQPPTPIKESPRATSSAGSTARSGSDISRGSGSFEPRRMHEPRSGQSTRTFERAFRDIDRHREGEDGIIKLPPRPSKDGSTGTPPRQPPQLSADDYIRLLERSRYENCLRAYSSISYRYDSRSPFLYANGCSAFGFNYSRFNTMRALQDCTEVEIETWDGRSKRFRVWLPVMGSMSMHDLERELDQRVARGQRFRLTDERGSWYWIDPAEVVDLQVRSCVGY